jgi:hypothetical protein
MHVRHPSRWRRPAALSLLLTALVCCRCGHGPRRNAEELIDKDSPLIVSVPSLGEMADHVEAMREAAKKGGNTTIEWILSMTDQKALGFDVFSRTGQKGVGLDPEGSLAIAGTSRHGGYVVLPYTDLNMLLSTIRKLGNDRRGATVEGKKKIGNTTITTLARAADGPAELAWVSNDSVLIVGIGEACVENVAAAAERKPETSAARAGPFAAQKGHVGPHDLFLYAPQVPPLLAKVIPQGVVLGLSTSASELSLRAFLATAQEHTGTIAHAIVGGASPIAQLPLGQPVYLRGGADWSSVAATLSGSSESKEALQQLRNSFQQADIDLDKDVLANLKPGFAAAVGLAATANLSTALQLNPALQNPFDNYSLIAVGEVNDAAKAQATLTHLPKLLESVGATTTTRELDGSPVYTAHYRLGEGLSWTLLGTKLIAVGGFGEKLDSTLQGLKKGTTVLRKDQFSPTAGDVLFGEKGFALAMDFHRLTEEVNGLPSTAPGAFMVRSMVDSTLKSVDQLKPVLAIAPAEGGMMVDLVTNVK